MKTIIIRRLATCVHGTFGVMINNNIPFAVTLEREWLDNQTGISCIPEGTYICGRVDSPRFKNTFEVKDVPGRSHILFHKGNIDDDSHGCILIGEQFETIKGSPAILASKHGFNEFLNKLTGENEFRAVFVDDWKNPIN